jgi:hypothetical protein
MKFWLNTTKQKGRIIPGRQRTYIHLSPTKRACRLQSMRGCDSGPRQSGLLAHCCEIPPILRSRPTSVLADLVRLHHTSIHFLQRSMPKRAANWFNTQTWVLTIVCLSPKHTWTIGSGSPGLIQNFVGHLTQLSPFSPRSVPNCPSPHDPHAINCWSIDVPINLLDFLKKARVIVWENERLAYG